MNLFLEIEDTYYSIYKIELIDELLILYFRDSRRIELGSDEFGTPTIFCDQYFQLFHTPAPSFDSKTWNVFVEMLIERAQELKS